LESAATSKENEAAARQQRQLDCVAKKTAAGIEKVAWQQLRNEYKARAAAWAAERDCLMQANLWMPKKDLPAKPQAPWKANL